jgi:citronellol/citronellal dehydrogenase
MSLKNNPFITGASRGIGLAIAAARRSRRRQYRDRGQETPHPKLEGTIHSAAEAIEKVGGQ